MNGLPYYKRYPRDFIDGTISLPFEVKGAYSIVLDLIYIQGGALPDDPRYIAGVLGVSVRKWNSIRSVLVEKGKLKVSGEFLTNYRADKETETLRSFQEKQAENASRPRKNKDLSEAVAEPKDSHTESESESEENTNVFSFDDFWEICPRKVGKGAARKAFQKAVKAEDPEVIFSAMKRHAQAVRGKDAQYIPHPSTWLNQERWSDEPDPNQSSGADLAKRVAERFGARRVDSGEDRRPAAPLPGPKYGTGGA